MRIGVDIDGVLTYRTQVLRAYGTKFCVETGKGGLANPEAISIREMFGWDEETRDEFWYKFGKYYMILAPAQAFAAEVIKKLREAGNEIWIVTGRNEGDKRIEGMQPGETWQELTEKWLAENGIEYDQMGFDQQNKAEYCRENQIEVMVEDDPGYLEGFDERTKKVLIFDQPYNQEVRMPNAERVCAWYDVYSKIKEML